MKNFRVLPGGLPLRGKTPRFLTSSEIAKGVIFQRDLVTLVVQTPAHLQVFEYFSLKSALNVKVFECFCIKGALNLPDKYHTFALKVHGAERRCF